MAAPVDAIIITPDDSGNAGKKLRTQTRTVGSNTVHENFYVQVRQAALLGVYRMATAQLAILAAATNGTTTGLLWIHNPTATSNKKARIRRLFMTSQHSTALATPTAPRVRADRMTFSGTASGGAITAAKIDSGAAAPILDIRTAVTGLTPSLVAALGTGAVCGALTAVGAWAPAVVDIIPPAAGEDEWPILAPGEGIAVYQDTAGTASDTRLVNICMVWDEVDTA